MKPELLLDILKDKPKAELSHEPGIGWKLSGSDIEELDNEIIPDLIVEFMKCQGLLEDKSPEDKNPHKKERYTAGKKKFPKL